MRPYQRMRLIGIRSLNGQNGIVLPMILSLAFVFSLASAGLSLYSGTIAKQAREEANHIRTFYMAEAATERAVGSIKLFLQKKGRIPTAAELNQIAVRVPHGGSAFSYSGGAMNISQGQGVTKKLTAGGYKGLNGSVQPITISVTANNSFGNGNAGSVTMTQQIEVQQIPVFQFGVFYQNDLEILPGPSMTFVGPVHSNANIYLSTDNSLSFDSGITAFGSITHGRKDSSNAMTGDVSIKDGSGNFQSMKNADGSWLDHSASDWATASNSRWNGNVADSAQNTLSLNLPIPASDSPHAMIDRRVGGESAQIQSQKMDYKAQVRIIDGALYNQSGSTLELRYCSGGGSLDSQGKCPGGQAIVNPIKTSTFNNFREGKTIKATDIDVNLLNNSPSFKSLADANNGIIIYSSDQRNSGSATTEDAVRLVNGSTLYNKGMTVATENPLYIKGDFNTVNKQPAGVISDAFNILSNSWNDANSSNSNLGARTASNTTVQVAVITGNTNTTPGNYNGGFENIPRFLEGWSGKTLTYTGSVVVLYNSQFATGNWIYGSPYYTAPTRNWSFDTDFSNANYNIPGFPSVYTVAKSDWKVQ